MTKNETHRQWSSTKSIISYTIYIYLSQTIQQHLLNNAHKAIK